MLRHCSSSSSVRRFSTNLSVCPSYFGITAQIQIFIVERKTFYCTIIIQYRYILFIRCQKRYGSTTIVVRRSLSGGEGVKRHIVRLLGKQTERRS